MAGKKGQETSFHTDVPADYTPGWLRRLDGRLALAKALQQRIDALEADLGGKDSLSYQQRSLVNRAIFIEQHVINAECAMAQGEPVDHQAWLQAVAALRAIYRDLGLKRVPKDIPNLHDYLEQNYGDAKSNGT